MENQITILPIFDQAAPTVWDDFIKIRAAAWQLAHNYTMTARDYDDWMDEMQSSWQCHSFHFAFGAYDGPNMIGYSNGDCIKRVSTVRGLYVLPQYQGQGIGDKMLRSVELASAFGADRMDLVSLHSAKTLAFYRNRNWTPIYAGSNEFVKRIQIPQFCRSVPMFRCTPSMDKVCSQIAGARGEKFDAADINVRHLPAYVYVDTQFKINGYAIGDETGRINQLCISRAWPTDWVKRYFNTEFNKRSIVNAARNEKSR